MPKRGRFAREVGEDGLHDVLGLVRITQLPESCAVNHGKAPANQFPEGFLGAIVNVTAQQFGVISHYPLLHPSRQKADKKIGEGGGDGAATKIT